MDFILHSHMYRVIPRLLLPGVLRRDDRLAASRVEECLPIEFRYIRLCQLPGTRGSTASQFGRLPAHDDRKAGSEMALAALTPTPPNFTGIEACFHAESLS